MALAVQRRDEEARTAAQELERLAPEFKLDDVSNLLNRFQGNPTGKLGAMLDQQIDSLRDVWPD